MKNIPLQPYQNTPTSSQTVVRVDNVLKTFRIPHEKHTSLKSAALNIYKKKTYTTFNALKNISFEIKQGEFFGIIGRNGSGKSTLLKLLAGIYVPNDGKIAITGKISPFLELGVGFNPELTARENIFLGGAVLGLIREEIAPNFDKIIEFAELENFVDMKFKNFSSGMQVRLAFTLAINVYADILLMDEVLAVGDSNFQTKCLKVFESYKKEGKTIILVSHDLGIMEKYCDRILLLESGKMQKIGSPRDVIRYYTGEDVKQEIVKKKPPKPQKPDKKIFKIKKIIFLSRQGKINNSFCTGEDFSVRVHFEKVTQIETSINYGIGIYDKEDNHIFGIGSIMEKVSEEKKKQYYEQNYFQINFHNVPLKTGTYYVRAGIFGETNTVIYDLIEKSDPFKFRSKNNYQGIIELQHDWQ